MLKMVEIDRQRRAFPAALLGIVKYLIMMIIPGKIVICFENL